MRFSAMCMLFNAAPNGILSREINLDEKRELLNDGNSMERYFLLVSSGLIKILLVIRLFFNFLISDLVFIRSNLMFDLLINIDSTFSRLFHRCPL